MERGLRLIFSQYGRLLNICVLRTIRTVVNLSFKIMSDCPSDPNVPPIIILHDLLGTKRHWESMGKTLYNVMKRSVIIVDLRNHGDSPHVNSHKYKDVAQDVLHLYKKLAIRRATLVGHSIGGRTCMCAALMAVSLSGFPVKIRTILAHKGG